MSGLNLPAWDDFGDAPATINTDTSYNQLSSIPPRHGYTIPSSSTRMLNQDRLVAGISARNFQQDSAQLHRSNSAHGISSDLYDRFEHIEIGRHDTKNLPATTSKTIAQRVPHATGNVSFSSVPLKNNRNLIHHTMHGQTATKIQQNDKLDGIQEYASQNDSSIPSTQKIPVSYSLTTTDNTGINDKHRKNMFGKYPHNDQTRTQHRSVVESDISNTTRSNQLLSTTPTTSDSIAGYKSTLGNQNSRTIENKSSTFHGLDPYIRSSTYSSITEIETDIPRKSFEHWETLFNVHAKPTDVANIERQESHPQNTSTSRPVEASTSIENTQKHSNATSKPIHHFRRKNMEDGTNHLMKRSLQRLNSIMKSLGASSDKTINHNSTVSSNDARPLLKTMLLGEQAQNNQIGQNQAPHSHDSSDNPEDNFLHEIGRQLTLLENRIHKHRIHTNVQTIIRDKCEILNNSVCELRSQWTKEKQAIHDQFQKFSQQLQTYEKQMIGACRQRTESENTKTNNIIHNTEQSSDRPRALPFRNFSSKYSANNDTEIAPNELSESEKTVTTFSQQMKEALKNDIQFINTASLSELAKYSQNF